jgi:hypothetical protein
MTAGKELLRLAVIQAILLMGMQAAPLYAGINCDADCLSGVPDGGVGCGGSGTGCNCSADTNYGCDHNCSAGGSSWERCEEPL